VTLAADGVWLAYGDGSGRPALADVTLELEPGRLTVVVGPNGAGKSTLLALLSGWLVPDRGEVTLEGRRLSAVRPRERARRVAYLPQEVAPLYDLPAAEVVAAGRFPHHPPWSGPGPDDLEAVRRAMAATDTAHLAARRFGALSGGERQRVLLAAVIAQGARWWLLDEPTASLDLHHAVGVFRLLRQAAAAGTGVVAVTHDLNLAALHADRLVLLDGGRVALDGPPERVLRDPALVAAYGPELVVAEHPRSRRPVVLPAAGEGP